MKILLTSSTNNITNGTGNLTHELCSFLNTKAEVTLLLPKNEIRYSYGKYRVEYILPDFIYDIKTPKVLPYLSFNYKTDADIVHSLSELPYAFLASRIAKRSGKSFVMGTQGTHAILPLFMWPEKYIIKYCYNNASIITTPSVFTRDHILKYAKTKTPIEIIHNGVNFERFQTKNDISDIRAQYPDKKIILTVGGLKPRKGFDVAIKSLGLVKKNRNDFHYICIGSGKHLDELKNLAKQVGIEENISFVGEKVGNEYVKYFQACDIYLHTPIVTDWNFEGFGIVYLEASACRKPIVSADSGGIKDAVLENKTGLVVPENDPPATAQAIEKMLDAPDLRKQFGDTGWEYAKNHDWPIISAKYLDLFEKVV